MYILLVIALIPILIHITGNNHVYKTVRLTIGMGSLSPSLFEYKYFPGALIESGTPQPWPVSREYNAVGLTPEEASFHEEYRSLAFVLIRKDSILFESYWDAEDTTWSNSFSMAKSFIAMALGAAIQDGLIQSIDELVGNYLPEFAEAPNDVLSIRHLLSMSSGIPYPESYINPFGFVAKLNYGTDIRSLVLSKSVEEEPGKYFHYSGANTQLLGMVIEAATGMPFDQYFQESIWQHIGAQREAYWSYDRKDGMAKASCCFNSNARDMAKLGKLMMDGGSWNGAQLIDPDFVKEAVVPADILEKNGSPCVRYGLQWWVGNFSGKETFYARGINGQYVVCIPEEDLILVRLGWRRSGDRVAGHPLDLYELVESALRIGGSKS